MTNSIPPEVIERLAIWYRYGALNQAFGTALIVTGTLSGLAVTAFTETLGVNKTRVVGFTSAACTALFAAFSPISVANNFWTAWRELDQAATEFKYSNAPDIGKLLEAQKRGEQVLGHGYNGSPHFPSPPTTNK